MWPGRVAFTAGKGETAKGKRVKVAKVCVEATGLYAWVVGSLLRR